jgi:hypothetical protein
MSDIFLPPDVHYDAATAFNISDIFTDVPAAFLSAIRRRRHCCRDGTTCENGRKSLIL